MAGRPWWVGTGGVFAVLCVCSAGRPVVAVSLGSWVGLALLLRSGWLRWCTVAGGCGGGTRASVRHVVQRRRRSDSFGARWLSGWLVEDDAASVLIESYLLDYYDTTGNTKMDTLRSLTC